MNLSEFENRFNRLPENFKTKDLDIFAKKLIKEKVNVSFLRTIILQKQKYHRIYFQVSLANLKSINEKLDFIENNFDYLSDWWHVDQLSQFVDKELEFDDTYIRAKNYIQNQNQFARRWGYVVFMPTLVKDKKYKQIFSLFKDNDEYYDVMAQAWLISYLAMYHFNDTYEYIKAKPLKYNIIGKAIQKTCDSFRVTQENKNKLKELRKLYK